MIDVRTLQRGPQMPQLFPRSADAWFLGIAGGAVLTIALIVAVGMTVARSPYVTGQAIRREQPVPFSHQHHVADAGIDCRYCHATVEKSAMAGLPTSEVCMNCHRVLWNQSKMLEPVRLSYRDNIPIQWNRVHDLPDHVYFNHSIHIKKGIGCYSCHGRIDEMPLTEQAQPLNMEWCLDCHRDPRQHVRPAQFLYVTKPLEELIAADARSAERVRAQAAATQQPKSRTDCYTCHR